MFASPVAKARTKSATAWVGTVPDQRSMSGSAAAQIAGRGIAWDFGRISVAPPNRCDLPIARKPRLAIGSTADPLEQEADRVAEQVMGMSAPGIAIGHAGLGLSRSCAACAEEEPLQRKAAGIAEVAPAEAPGIVHEVLQAPGQPLDPETRAFFEPRFGSDFSHVRVHMDAEAGRSAQAVDALAYTSGRDVVFGDGRYAPRTREGQRLLAHELTHVVQQTEAGSTAAPLRREPDKAPERPPEQAPKRTPEKTPQERQTVKRQDIVLLGEGWEGGRELSAVLAHGGRVIAVTSVADAAKQLAQLDRPIGTLYFVTHSTTTGELKFGKDEGFTKAADIAAKLKGSVSADNAPQTVDFRGCSVGNSPRAMDDIRTALGANSVVAGNCFAVIDRTTPIKMGIKGQETAVTHEVEVPKTSRKRFEELYWGTFDKFVAKFDGKKGCVVTRSEKDFFAAGGRFVALWFNSSFSAEWIKGKSVCYIDATTKTVDPAKPAAAIEGCSVVTVNAPEPKAADTKP